MISNLTLLSLAIAKAALYTGIGPAIAIVVLYEVSGMRIVRVGIEKVSASGQLATRDFPKERESPTAMTPSDWATSPPRKVRAA